MDEFREMKENLERQEMDKELDVSAKDWAEESEDDSKEEKTEASEKLNNVSFGYSQAECLRASSGTQNYCLFAGAGR